MEEDVDGNIKTFETILKTYSVSKSLLYNDIINKEMSQILKSEDVIKSISRQIQDMNCIENHSKAFTNKINAYKESRLMCINNMLPLETQQKHLVPSTFDNHCGYDTQLLLATKDAEALTPITGVTQEFDTSFDQKPNSIISHRDIELNVDRQTIHSDVLKINVNSQHRHDDIQRDDSNAVCNTENLEEDVTISSSPILHTEMEKCQHNTSFLLESFEKFEAIAIPIVQENSDIEAVKGIIKYKILHDNKSQIKSEQSYKSESMQLSPILKLRTDQEQVERQTKSLNNEESVEEEVIFSSDEKTDSDHIQDLPLTCALQTSFYEQELVLDKKIYVGFQTASNKSIKVLTDSFTRAKSVLNDCYNITKATHSLSLSELVEVHDSASREKEIIPTPVKSKSSNATCTCITGRNDFNDKIISCDKENKLYSHDRDIFSQTKKEDICTEEHIKIDDYIMQEFEDNMCIDDNKLHTNLRVSNKSVILNNDANVYPYILNTSLDEEQNKMCNKEIETKNFNFQVDKKLFLNEYQTDKTNNTAKEVNQLFTRFKTASNKCIDISEAALVKSIKILDEANFQSSLITDECNHKIYGTNNVINKRFHGFTTASNEPISISDEAYAHSKKVLQEIQSPFVFKDKNENYNEKENADETPNARDLSKGMNNNVDIHFGFKTASNIPINVSKEALLKSKFFLQEFEYDNDILINNEKESVQILHNPDFKDEFCVKFESVSSNLLHIPESEYCRKKKNNLEVKCVKQEFSRLAATKNAFQGFETSNNNQVVISDQGLEKSKKIFLDIGDCNNSDLEIVKDQKQEIKRLTSIKNAFQGFKTASNNPVVISDEALKKSKKIFQDIDDCDSHPVKDPKREFSRFTSITNAIQGFKTASNNPVVISDEALKKCKKIFQDIDDSNDGDSYPVKHPQQEFSRLTSITNAFQGFKTASNNPVVISDEALKKSKKVFQDIGDYNNYNPETFKIENNVFIEPNAPNVPFQGFKTAGNNSVKISSDALKRSKRLFQDIDDNNDFYMRMRSPPEKIIIESTTLNDIDFQKVKNKPVNLFEEALKTGKIIIEDVDSNIKSKIKQKINGIASRQNASVNIKNNFHEYETHLQLEAKKSIIVDDQTIKHDDDVSNIINTEVIQHFNETMLTEEFLDKSPNKRPGSPILSCPKAKKMKTKYPSGPVFEGGSQPIRKINKFIFNNDYKKYKKYKLFDVYAMERNLNTKQSCNQVNYNIDKISSLEFVGARNEISNSKWTNVDIKKYFLELVNKNIIPNGWIENHIKLVTLKLFTYEKKFPNAMQNVCSVGNVLEQLKYRYEREVYNVERPALRKILEKDEVPSRRMVLQVLDIYKDGVSITNTLNSVENVELLLSDGWYYVKATIDKLLTKLICEDKITSGTKLVTHGAELLNCEQGIPPWEDTSLVRLKIFGNSTRRAHWTAKLGFHGNGAILSHLTAVKPEGGKISQLRVVVTRVYPMLYVEKFDDGSTVTRSERLENLYQMKHEAERETLLEKIYEEVEREFCMQVSQYDTVDCDRKGLESGSQIYQLMKKSRDPAEFRAGLTHSQATSLRDYVDKRREVTLQDIQAKVQSVLKKRGLNVTRNVVAMLKIRVADVYKQNVTKAMITIWRPHESLLHLVREGAWLDIYNIVPTGVRYSEIQISAGKQSLFRKTSKVNDNMLKIAKTLQRKCYLIEELTLNPYMSTEYNEVDLIGFVFDVQPSVQEFDCKKQLFQNVFVADVNKRIICINFWGGLKKFGFENILEVDQVIACVNLQKRSGNTRKNIPQYRATEFTIFTKTPRGDECRKKCEDLSKQFLSLDRRKFTQDCILLRNNLVNMKYGNIENISPYRFNNSDCNLSKNKVFINSDLNLNGLDFDSTFKQSDTLSPKALLRKKDISERIAKLRKYGDPPPLSTIHIVNKNKDAVKPYRSPLLSNVEFKNNQPTRAEPVDKPQSPSNSDDNLGDEKSNKCPSPVLPYKRTVNPVRLNFTKQNNVSKDDPFGEDFETSPPLSLD